MPINNLPTRLVLVTGVAGFIGYHMAKRYIEKNITVVGIDDPSLFTADNLRYERKKALIKMGLHFQSCNLGDDKLLQSIVDEFQPEVIFHFAACTSARESNKQRLIESNIAGLVNMVKAAKKSNLKHLLFASSSSMYGENSPLPFSEKHNPSMPNNAYAKSKWVGETIVKDFLSGDFPITALRFFNVYGPWGRHNMAPFVFAKNIIENKFVPIINETTSRPWLYIDDAIDFSITLANLPLMQGNLYRSINIAGPQLIKTSDLLTLIEGKLNTKARIKKEKSKIQEISSNSADLSLLESLVGRTPQITVNEGLDELLSWLISISHATLKTRTKKDCVVYNLRNNYNNLMSSK